MRLFKLHGACTYTNSVLIIFIIMEACYSFVENQMFPHPNELQWNKSAFFHPPPCISTKKRLKTMLCLCYKLLWPHTVKILLKLLSKSTTEYSDPSQFYTWDLKQSRWLVGLKSQGLITLFAIALVTLATSELPSSCNSILRKLSCWISSCH